MPDILVRGLDPKTVEHLKLRAKRHGRSVQSEAKMLLEQAAGASREEIAAMFTAWKKRFAGREFDSSTDILRKDRDR